MHTQTHPHQTLKLYYQTFNAVVEYIGINFFFGLQFKRLLPMTTGKVWHSRVAYITVPWKQKERTQCCLTFSHLAPAHHCSSYSGQSCLEMSSQMQPIWLY